MADAFVSQMAAEAENLRQAKMKVESDLAAGRPLEASRLQLDQANEAYKLASLTVRKHIPKAKAQAKAGATAKWFWRNHERFWVSLATFMF